jgi:peptidyl-prolyl isomerase D
LTSEEAEAASKVTADTTGDKYEDYPEDQGSDLDGKTIATIASDLKDIGNAQFKAGNLPIALEKYQKALRYLNEYPGTVENDPPELQGQLDTLRINLNSNSAQAQLKLKEYGDAVLSATNALEVASIGETDKVKVLYRRALANIALKDEAEGLVDLTAAAKLQPSNALVSKELSAIKAREKERTKKEKARMQKFFEL